MKDIQGRRSLCPHTDDALTLAGSAAYGAAMEEKAFRHNVTERKPLKKPLAVHRGFMPFTLNYHAMIYTN